VIFRHFFTGSARVRSDDVSETLSAVERRHILAVFESSGESVEQTAQRLGISETLTRNRLKRYGRIPAFVTALLSPFKRNRDKPSIRTQYVVLNPHLQSGHKQRRERDSPSASPDRPTLSSATTVRGADLDDPFGPDKRTGALILPRLQSAWR
jgi:hypothetical protein